MDKIATKAALEALAQAVNDKIQEEINSINAVLEAINGD